jgi:hypothetical protein
MKQPKTTNVLSNLSLAEIDKLEMVKANEILNRIESNTQWRTTENNIMVNGKNWTCKK